MLHRLEGRISQEKADAIELLPIDAPFNSALHLQRAAASAFDRSQSLVELWIGLGRRKLATTTFSS